MKMILSFVCVLTLLSGSGCLVAEDGRHERRHEHGEFHEHSEVIVARPVIVAPEVRVRVD